MTTKPPEKAGALAACPNPWCEALEREGDFSPAVRLHHFGTYRVVCTSCVMEGPLRPTEAEAITAWNTRSLRQTEYVLTDPQPFDDDNDPAPPVTREAVLEEAARVAEYRGPFGDASYNHATSIAAAIRALKSEPVVGEEIVLTPGDEPEPDCLLSDLSEPVVDQEAALTDPPNLPPGD